MGKSNCRGYIAKVLRSNAWQGSDNTPWRTKSGDFAVISYDLEILITAGIFKEKQASTKSVVTCNFIYNQLIDQNIFCS